MLQITTLCTSICAILTSLYSYGEGDVLELSSKPRCRLLFASLYSDSLARLDLLTVLQSALN
jgi:hypothetical protein